MAAPPPGAVSACPVSSNRKEGSESAETGPRDEGCRPRTLHAQIVGDAPEAAPCDENKENPPHSFSPASSSVSAAPAPRAQLPQLASSAGADCRDDTLDGAAAAPAAAAPAAACAPASSGAPTPRGSKNGMSRELLKLLSGSGNSFDELCFAFNPRSRHASAGASNPSGSVSTRGRRRDDSTLETLSPQTEKEGRPSSASSPAQASGGRASVRKEKKSAASVSPTDSKTNSETNCSPRTREGPEASEGQAAASGCVCVDEETAKAIATALAAEMETCRELSSLLKNGKGGDQGAVPEEILLALAGQKARRPLRSCAAPKPAQATWKRDAKAKSRGSTSACGKSDSSASPRAASCRDSSAASLDLSLKSGRSSRSLKAGSTRTDPQEPAENREKEQVNETEERHSDVNDEKRLDNKEEKSTHKREQKQASKREKQEDKSEVKTETDSRRVLEEADEATQAAIAALLAEEIGASREAAKLLAGEGEVQAYGRLAASLAGGLGCRRRATRQLAALASASAEAANGKGWHDDVVREKRSKKAALKKSCDGGREIGEEEEEEKSSPVLARSAEGEPSDEEKDAWPDRGTERGEGEEERQKRKKGKSRGVRRQKKAEASETREAEEQQRKVAATTAKGEAESSEDEALCLERGRNGKRKSDLVNAELAEKKRKKAEREEDVQIKEEKGTTKLASKETNQAKTRRKAQTGEGGGDSGEERETGESREVTKRERTSESAEASREVGDVDRAEVQTTPLPKRDGNRDGSRDDELSPPKKARTKTKSPEEESTTAEEEQFVKEEVENGLSLFSPRKTKTNAEKCLFSADDADTLEAQERGGAATVSGARHRYSATDGEKKEDEANGDLDAREATREREPRGDSTRAEEAIRTGEEHKDQEVEIRRVRTHSDDEGAAENRTDRRRASLPTACDAEGGGRREKKDRSSEEEAGNLERSDGQGGAKEVRAPCEGRPLKIRKRVIKANATVNFTLCGICGGFGDVLCCDFCPRVFHPVCLFKYHPLRVFVPVELREAAHATLSSSSSSPCSSSSSSSSSSSRRTQAADWGSLPPPPPPLPGYRSHSRALEDEQGRGRAEASGSAFACATPEEDAKSLWMCPDCYGVPYSASRPTEHPAWRVKCVDWRRLAEEESHLFLSFPSLDAVQPYFGDEDAWRSFRDRKGEKLLKRSAQIAKTVTGATKAGREKQTRPAKTVFLRLGDFPLTPARHLLYAMGKKTALQAVGFLKNLLLRVASSSKEEEQMNFLEFGAEVAYLLTNLLGYLGASKHLVDPIVDAASCILLLWSKRRRKLGKEAIMTDEALIFSTLEACWAQLVLHRYSTTSGLRASPSSTPSASLAGSSPKTTLSCSLGEQKLYYREWKEEVERSIAASRLEFLYFDFRAGQLLYYDLSTCPNCDRSGGVSGRYAVCSLCNFLLPPEWACVDFGRLFEQLVWGSLMQRAGITPCEAKKGRSCWGGSSPVEQILLEMKSSLRPWRRRLDLGTEDWKNQVYMVTHALFVVSGWGRYRLDLRERFWLPDTRFLRLALHEAMLVGDVELTGEILHSLHLFLVSDSPRRSSSPSAASGNGDGAAGRPSPPRLLTEEEEEELQAEQFAIDLAIQHGIIYLLYRQSKSHRGCWTAKQDSFYKTFHTSFCAAIGLIRPHRGSAAKSASSSSFAAATSASAPTVDRTHSKWQHLFCSSWPAASVSLAAPNAVDFLGASRAAMLGPAVSKARRAADDAPPVFPLSCGAPHSLRPRSRDDVAIRIATVKVFVRRPLRRMCSSLWRRVCASSIAASRNSKKHVKLFGEKGLLGPDVFGKTEEISVGVYSFQGLCCVSLDDLSTLLLCESAFLEHRVLAFIRTALVLPVIDAQQAHANRHVLPEFRRFFTAFENRNCLNGGADISSSLSSEATPPLCSSSGEARREDGGLSQENLGRVADGRGGTRAVTGTKKLFSLLDLKELLTLQAMLGIAEALVLPIEENVGALLRAVENQVFKPVEVHK
ncbi:hypothetical protein TGVEG_271740 [Toxoplasma gondii VEG]|uniref:Zinc finger PHD-type domain-containing protein n=1 Tax=Toxoplasma gondii (strain ATCC 50861 / VEG) TaxID=432359 RepID=B9Q6B6_TOXGV|nr:hypothetical protein TGVEG_271740 [Toxoplasma gondii VEG]CEL75229.1 TPA: hypothetical protein BN1205_019180 [Toxoplasma gondii VEG]